MECIPGSDHSTGILQMNKIDMVLGTCPFGTDTIKGKQSSDSITRVLAVYEGP